MQFDQLLHWVMPRTLEILGLITGLLYLYFQVKEHILLWFFGLISSGIYIFVFFQSRIYADMAINIYYFAVSIYGWLHWSYGKPDEKSKLPIKRLSSNLLIKILTINVLLFGVIYYVLHRFTDTDVALIDAFTTSSSIVATWMLAQKILEHWIFWIVIDAVSAGLYVYKELYPTVILFMVYTVVSFVGYINWKRNWQQKNT